MLHRVLGGYDGLAAPDPSTGTQRLPPPPDYDPVAWKAKKAAWR